MADRRRRVRIGIDTGGTFTDVVAVDEDTGTVVTTKTPSTPADPAEGFLAGIDKILDLIGARRTDRVGLHGTTVATNQLLQGKVGRWGSSPPPATSHARDRPADRPGRIRKLLFLGKADRIVPADRVRTVGGRLDYTGDELRPFDEDAARRGGPVLREPRASPRSASVSCTPTRTRRTSSGCAR